MIEQPAEKSEMEIQAEQAAASLQQQPPVPHAFMRFLTWCMPTFAFYLIIILFGNLSSFIGIQNPQVLLFALPLCLVVNYALGCYDGLLAPQHVVASAEQRKKRILLHGIYFAAQQIWLIPAISVIIIGLLNVVFGWM